MLTWFEVEVEAVSVLFDPATPVSYSPSNELWDDAEAVPVLDSRFNYPDEIMIYPVNEFIVVNSVSYCCLCKCIGNSILNWQTF